MLTPVRAGPISVNHLLSFVCYFYNNNASAAGGGFCSFNINVMISIW